MVLLIDLIAVWGEVIQYGLCFLTPMQHTNARLAMNSRFSASLHGIPPCLRKFCLSS